IPSSQASTAKYLQANGSVRNSSHSPRRAREIHSRRRRASAAIIALRGAAGGRAALGRWRECIVRERGSPPAMRAQAAPSHKPAGRCEGGGTSGLMSTPVEITWLLAAVAKGDAVAFERLYGATSPKLYGVVLRILRRHDLAAEVLEQAYLQIWRDAVDY